MEFSEEEIYLVLSFSLVLLLKIPQNPQCSAYKNLFSFSKMVYTMYKTITQSCKETTR